MIVKHEEMKKNTILVVDDQAQNIKLVGTLIRDKYNVLVADNGEKAIKTAQEKLPDLILLDVMMPEMSGFETCLVLKKIEKTQKIPIIFLTAKNETEDIVYGFEIGGVDYITKPFRHQEILARIETHLGLKNSREIIELQNTELETKNNELKQYQDVLERRNSDLQTALDITERQAFEMNRLYSQMIESEQTLQKSNEELVKMNEAKDKFMSILAHDLRSPFSGILSITDLIKNHFETFSKDELIEVFESLDSNARDTFRFLEELLEWTRAQMGTSKMIIERLDLYELVFNSIFVLSNLSEMKDISIENRIIMGTHIVGDRNMLSTVIRNIVSNAIKFTNRGGRITIFDEPWQSFEGKKYVQISIKDSGIGMPQYKIEKLFELGEKRSTRGTEDESGSGLGLIICNDFVRKHNGLLEVESEEGVGTTFTIKLPL